SQRWTRSGAWSGPSSKRSVRPSGTRSGRSSSPTSSRNTMCCSLAATAFGTPGGACVAAVRRPLPLLALMLASASAMAGQTKPAITLQQAIERANAVQPLVVQALTGVEQADARIRAAKGAWLPNLTFTTTGASLFREGAGTDQNTQSPIAAGTTSNTIN